MGLRFRKSFKVAPGVKINLNKKSAGVTIGTKGAHYTVNTSGRRTASIGLPGTGLSYSTSTGGKKRNKSKASAKNSLNKIIGIVIAAAAIVCAAGAIKTAVDQKAAAITQDTLPPQNTGTAAADPGNARTAASTGSVRTSDSSQTAGPETEQVWISGSGQKYHTKSDCSGMTGATQIALSEALEMGKEACKRCYP